MSIRRFAPRSIILLCQECHGDMMCVSRGDGVAPKYVCMVCRRVWTYLRGGWKLWADTMVQW